MKFLLKIFVFMAILLISKFTKVEPAPNVLPEDPPHHKTALVDYSPPADTTAIEPVVKKGQLPKVYN